jgi:NAD(P)-dependent dehydrogenase (short-subunit alcohol dehydrogenase family)
VKYILITGSSTGIGRTAALTLAEKFHIFAGVRSAADGESLKAEASKNITPVILDVTDKKSIASAFEKINGEVGEHGLHALVNNAGIAIAGPLEAIPTEDLRLQFEVNVIGLVAVTQTFLPLLRKAAKSKKNFSRIVNVGSIAGRMAVPFIGAYSASKFAVESITDAFRRELAPQKIKVSLIEPGAVQTPIWKKSATKAYSMREKLNVSVEEIYRERLAKFETVVQKTVAQAVSVEKVVDAISNAITSQNPKTRYLVGTEARVQALMAQVLSDRTIDFIFSKQV